MGIDGFHMELIARRSRENLDFRLVLHLVQVMFHAVLDYQIFRNISIKHQTFLFLSMTIDVVVSES